MVRSRLSPVVAGPALACALACTLPTVADAARVLEFSPAHWTPDARQAVARFDRPMVAFGDATAASPFTVDCAVGGSGHWLDPTRFVFDFDQPLPATTRCRFHADARMQALDGSALTPSLHAVDAGPAGVVHVAPFDGHEAIDAEQVFLLGFDAPLDADSLGRGAWCKIDGIAERVEVEVLAGAERAALLADYEDFRRVYRHRLDGYDSRPISMLLDGEVLAGDNAARFARLWQAAPSPVAALRCRRQLPPDTGVVLAWDEGVRGVDGAAVAPARFRWRTRPDFRARFSCRRASPEAGCNPVLPMTVTFSAPIPRQAALAAELVDLGGRVRRPVLADDEPLAWRLDFPPPFDEDNLYTLSLPAPLHDDAGRVLVNAARFPLDVRTGVAGPLIKFPAEFGIIEHDEAAALPVTLRDVEPEIPLHPAPGGKVAGDGERGAATGWLSRLRESWWPAQATVNGRMQRIDDPNRAREAIGRVRESQRQRGHYAPELRRYVVDRHPGEVSLFDDDDHTTAFRLPKPHGRRAMEVIGIPMPRPGFYLVEIASPRLGAALYEQARPYHAQTAVLVTDLVVHFKHGRESSLAWVTRLHDGLPVDGAEVTVADCDGSVLFQGRSDADGIRRIPRPLPALTGDCYDYLVSARLGEDMTFTLSGWSEGIEPWRFSLPHASWTTPHLAATVFDRPLYRAGEVVHMKHYLRRHRADGIALPDAATLPEQVELVHEGSGERLALPVRFDAEGIAEGSWSIPGEARPGRYQVQVSLAGDGGEVTLPAGGFRVESFQLPSMTAEVRAVPDSPVRPARVDAKVQVSYLNGGGAAALEVGVRSRWRTVPPSFAGYEDYALANGDVVTGMESEVDEVEATIPALQRLTLDGDGGGQLTLSPGPVVQAPTELTIEAEYPDANGEIATSASRTMLWPSSVLAGLRVDGWVLSRDNLSLRALALDTDGRPLAGQTIRVDAFKRTVYTHRKRLVGGFYAYESRRQTDAVGRLCEGRTDALGGLDCRLPAPAEGNLVLRASVVDDNGHASHAWREVWVAGQEHWWFQVGDEDRMDVIAEQPRLEPGDTARLQVRMPFRRATALVTLEREGILDAFVTRLDGRQPVLEVPVLASHAPNVFVSVLAVRGRIAGRAPDGLVDLDKPAFRLGIEELTVGRAAHRLDVAVSTDRAVYRDGDSARVAVEVRGPDGTPAATARIALAAVDEGLLALAPNPSWQLLESMMGRRGIEVRTATAQMQVVGKRHFGKKAVAAGGGGGLAPTRMLFDSLLSWQHAVTDADGRVDLVVPLNDALSAFRIVAVASHGADRFGTGQASIASRRALMLLPAVPPLLRHGDVFQARVTVRNGTSQVREVAVSAKVDGRALPAQHHELPAQGSVTARWRLVAPADGNTMQLVFDARAGDTGDRVAVQRPLRAAVPVTVQGSTLLDLAKPRDLPVSPPATALAGRGGLRLGFSASLAGDLRGVVDHMQAYPHRCLEQRLSRAVVLDNAALRQAWLDDLPAALDGDGLARYWPSQSLGSDVLTSYLLSLSDAAGWTLPDAARRRMLDALAALLDGRLQRASPMAAPDQLLRRLAALEAVSRYRPLDPGWLTTIEADPGHWPTSALLDWLAIHRRQGDLPGAADRVRRARALLRARLDVRGGVVDLAGRDDDTLPWLMINGNGNAARTLLALLEAGDDDAARMARGLLARRQQGHFGTTTANAWAMLALRAVHGGERPAAPSGETTVSSADAALASWSWPGGRDGSVLLPWAGAQPLRIEHRGDGAPWVTVDSLAAVPLDAPVARGYRVERRVEAVVQRRPPGWQVGDVARVVLTIEATAERAWVVVDDPLPAGARILGSGLGNDSTLLVDDRGHLAPTFVERGDDAWRGYFARLPRGRWQVGYTVRYQASGRFGLPPTRVEAMYAPEVYGAWPNPVMTVAGE